MLMIPANAGGKELSARRKREILQNYCSLSEDSSVLIIRRPKLNLRFLNDSLASRREITLPPCLQLMK